MTAPGHAPALRQLLALATAELATRAVPARRISNASVGRGFIDPTHREGVKRIALTLDDVTFTRVRAVAIKKRVSFAAAARQLIERGFSNEAA